MCDSSECAWKELHSLCSQQYPKEQTFDDVIDYLGRKPEDAKECDEDGAYPLHHALRNKYPMRVVKALLDAWPAVLYQQEETNGYFALHEAVKAGYDFEIVKLLAENNPDAFQYRTHTKPMLSTKGLTVLELAKKIPQENPQREEILRFVRRYFEDHLISLKPENQVGHAIPTLHQLCEEKPGMHNASIYYQIKKRIETHPEEVKKEDTDGKFPLQLALRHQYPIEVIKPLFLAWPNAVRMVDEDTGFYPLHDAIKAGCAIEVFELLKEAYPDALNHRTKTHELFHVKGATALDLAHHLPDSNPNKADLVNELQIYWNAHMPHAESRTVEVNAQSLGKGVMAEEDKKEEPMLAQ